ncbi:MAG: carbamoyl phosphate synthase small subunit [Clostridia bacterium]|nr:carbamoyl phosphate synthase small subunit [Clostridia bacterium]
MKKQKVYLTLQNGKVFEGYRFGAEKDATGELVFTTGMVGYLETLTEPANYGQIVVQTFPLIGNYGVMRSDLESKKAWVKAYVVREICDEPSNFRSEGKLDDFLKEENVVGIYGVDTRELTKILRDEGVMNATISSKPMKDLSVLNDYTIQNPVKEVTATELQAYGDGNSTYTVALWDFGAKNSTVNQLLSYGCKVLRVPANYTAEQILALSVDGVMLSDGPGDPADNSGIVAEIEKIIGKKPIFGVGLGHQLLALAFGSETEKMKYGHRGGQPVKYLESGKVYISSQNHGYVVSTSSVKVGNVNFVNANDDSCEGIDYPEYSAFSVQFNPESCSAACEPNVLYEKFLKNMKEKRNA